MVRRTALIAAVAGAGALAAAWAALAAVHPAGALDARALVVQPRAVGGIRAVTGMWSVLGDDGSYPLAAAFSGKPVPGKIAFIASYPGLAGSARGTSVEALAVVLPDAATARRLLASTSRLEGFVGDAAASLSPAHPPGRADAAVGGSDVHGTVTPGPVAIVAWTNGRLYGYVTASGEDARVRARRVAEAEEVRFEQALGGERLGVDPLLLAPARSLAPPFPPPAGKTVHPTATVPRISHPGRYTLRSLGAGRLWRVSTHVVVQLAADARVGRVEVSPRVSRTGGPGAELVIARDLGSGRTLLVEETRGTASARSLEVGVSAMMGGHPSPRQHAFVGFGMTSLGTGGGRSLERVTVLPDSAIEIFDDPAKIGREAMRTTLSRALP
jgi:hypothetical protein